MMSRPNLPEKGSPRGYPEAWLPMSSEPNQSQGRQAAIAGAHPFPGSDTSMQPRQRRIGRSKRGVRVSRCLPIAAETKPSKKTQKHRRRESLMEVSGLLASPYWGALLPPIVMPFKRGQGQAPTKERHRREPIHVGTIPEPVGRPSSGASYGSRQPENVADGKGQSQCPKKRRREKRGGFVDPSAWVAIQRSLLQQGQLCSSVSRDQVVDEAPSPPDIPSRTSSQRKALNRFIRELDKYATAAGAARRLPVITPTESVSVVSLHTVRPLLPYLNEFQSAGLAVTSEQQKPKHLAASNTRQSSRRQQPSKPTGDGCNGSPDPKPSACETSPVQSAPLHGISTAFHESSSLPKKKREMSRRKLPWLRPSTAKPEFSPLVMVAKPNTQLIKDGKIQSQWKEPCNFPATQDVESRSQPPLPQEHEGRVREMTHRDGLPDAPAVTSEAHQPSPPLQRDMAISQLPLPESTGGTNASLRRNDMTWTLNRPPKRTDPGSWLPRLPSRRSPGKLFVADHSSSAPKVPITWNHVAGSGSSLERALSAAIQDVGMKEADTDQRQEGIRQENLTAEKINKQPTLENPRRPGACTYDSQDAPAISHETSPGAKQLAKPAKKAPSIPRTREQWKAPNEAALQTMANIIPESPHAEAAIRLPGGLKKDDPLDKNTEPGTGGLVVSGYDHDGDGNVNDRDVLKGLRVAVQAAADEAFDTLIQDKTGLRIRQFLADLKMVGVLDVATGDERARARRTTISRLTRERARKPRAGSRT